MEFPITAIYAVILALLAIILGARVSLMRAKLGVSILDGGNTRLSERIRQHGNLAENLPLALILLGLSEAAGTGTVWLHVAGLMLLVGRVAHPIGLNAANPNNILRGLGSGLTTLSMLVNIVMIALGWI